MAARMAPFEWRAGPMHWAEKAEMLVSFLLLLPVLRVLATFLFAGLGALWCLFVYYSFRCLGPDPAKHPPAARRARVFLLRYPCMAIQRAWLFALGFYWIPVEGAGVSCGLWCGPPCKVDPP